MSVAANDFREGVVYDENGVRVTAFKVKHANVEEAFGFRVDYKGRAVVISGDMAPNENFIKYAHGADVILHEVGVARPELLEKNPVDIYFFISERLKTIRFFYETAAAPFTENIRKIEAGEDPYDSPPSDYDVESGEPAFLAEWQLNHDGLTLLGHSVIAMLQVTLKLYLDTYKQEVERFHGKQRWVPSEAKKARGENWFCQYREVFLHVLGIDWDEFGKEDIGIVEQITLARDDIFHQPWIWTVDTYQSKQHFAKYTESFFADERYLTHYKRTGHVFPRGTWAIDVPPERRHRAIDLVDAFCQFMEKRWMSWRKT